MRLPTATSHRTPYGEDAEAAVRAVLGLTAGVGGLSAAVAVATDQVPFTALPTLVVVACLLGGASILVAAYAAASIWLVLAPTASGEALLVPVAMIVLCLAIALGPERLLSWLARDAAPTADRAAGEGWIEEDPRRIG